MRKKLLKTCVEFCRLWGLEMELFVFPNLHEIRVSVQLCRPVLNYVVVQSVQ